MLRELDLSLHRRARIWQEELPKAGFDSSYILTASLPASSGPIFTPERRVFCIEYKANLGGRISYGLLGSIFERNDEVSLFSIKVLTKEAAWEVFESSFYGGLDPLLIGLPILFGESVRRVVSEFFSKADEPTPSGSLSFLCAAFSEVGSSQDVFERLAEIHCRYLISAEAFDDKGDLAGLFSVFGR